jgi:hypothetical protein
MTAADHPAPHRGRVPLWRQLFGLAGGPLAWAAQLNIGYALTSYPCNPGGHSAGAMLAGWAWTRGAALGLNGLAALVAVAAGLVSLGVWRATRGEKDGHPVDVGEGRTRFLGVCGAFTSFGFLAAIVFDTVMILGAPACRG